MAIDQAAEYRAVMGREPPPPPTGPLAWQWAWEPSWLTRNQLRGQLGLPLLPARKKKAS